jgi:NADPH:quinone reductase-like Zn-dependent oxidoreductase
MKAARLHVRGALQSLRYEDAPDPRPATGQVLIRVHAAGVTPTELQWSPTSVTRTGTPRPVPLILGHEFSGEVAALGDGVAGLRPGDAVYGLNDWFIDGASAEYCLAVAPDVARKPDSIDHVYAAVVPISGLTAWQGLFEHAHLERGQRVLIHGGAGGVGVFAVQLAHRRGAHVITTVSAHNDAFVRGLGADEVIDYRAVRFDDVVHDVDVVFDAVGGQTLQRSWAVLRPGGKLVTVAADAERPASDATRDAFFIVQANARQLTELARLIDAGELRPVVDAVFPLARARDAYEHRTQRGKAVLRVVDRA